MRERLGDHQPSLHAAGKGARLTVLAVPEREIAQQTFEIGIVRLLAEEAAAELDRRPHALEEIDGQFLRHEPDEGSRGAEVTDDVVTRRGDRARGRRDDAADDADQRRLAGAVGAEQGENFALADLKAHILQRRAAAGIGFR